MGFAKVMPHSFCSFSLFFCLASFDLLIFVELVPFLLVQCAEVLFSQPILPCFVVQTDRHEHFLTNSRAHASDAIAYDA